MLDQLERCQKALSEFLEEKRARFPRFYFIGDDDLLEILGQAKNPRVIQSHLKKLFAGAQDRNEARRFVAHRFFSRFKNVTIICQDRLGTNIVRKTHGETKRWRFVSLVQARKRHFLRHLYINALFYQDRLGTNMGKTQKKCRFLARFLSFAGIHSVEFTDDSANLTAMCGNRRRFWRRCTH
jgi:hypothetical protein